MGVDASFRAVNHIRESADFIYIHGYPSKTQINVYIPPYVENVSIVSDNCINIRVSIPGEGQDVEDSVTDIHGITRGRIQGNLSSLAESGNYVLDIFADPNDWVNISVV